MQFESTTLISHPISSVFGAYRDRLQDVVPYLPNVEKIEVRSREEHGSTVSLLNRWTGAATDIPKVVRGFLPAEGLQWDDAAQWDEQAHRCSFQIRIPAFGEAVRCDGTNTFAQTSGGTSVTLRGDFVVDVSKIPGIPRLLARTIGPQIESFVLKLLQPNLEKTAVAVGEFLDHQKES